MDDSSDEKNEGIKAISEELSNNNQAVLGFMRKKEEDMETLRQRELRKYWKQYTEGGGF